ncbi:MAG: sulfotransferase [Planctomycetaceae bacterium]|nr:sulfotransferase [Planctomycetaceae bacterium]
MSASSARASTAAWKSLGLWIGTTIAICAALQMLTWLVGMELSITGSSLGRSLLVVVAVVILLGLMTRDERPLTVHGVFIGPDWMRELGGAMLVGGAVFAGFHVLGAIVGGLVWQPDAFGARWVKATGEALVTSVPIAATQQVIFSGFLLTLLRSATGRTTAVILSALLFAAASVLGRTSEQIASTEGFWLFANLTLLSVLLANLRLLSGSILLPTGLLAGALLVRRSVWKIHLFIPRPESPLADWFALGSDPRQAPLLCGLLGVLTAATWMRLLRQGETILPSTGPALSAEFKKFVPFSNLLALAPLDLWLGRLREARFRIDPIYVPRVVWGLSVSAINTLITLPERWLAPRMLKHEVPAPVLIVGVHRSGTTHLHNLLALDPQFVAPRNLHVLNPFGALVMGWLITPLLGLFMTMRRPMDAMRVSLFSTQEEEFAIAGMTRLSPYWGFFFPKETDRHDRCVYPDEMDETERQEWRDCLVLFLRKLTFWSRRPPLLKSPYNTARVGEFQLLFRDVKVVHICRHPYQTYLSNMHLAEHGLASFQVQEPDADDNYRSRFLDHYRRMEQSFYRDAARLPAGHVCEVRYEDLAADPLPEIQRIYASLGLPYTLAFDTRLRRYLRGIAGYRKNRHPQLDPVVQAKIESRMGPYLNRWGYRDDAESSRPARAA